MNVFFGQIQYPPNICMATLAFSINEILPICSTIEIPAIESDFSIYIPNTFTPNGDGVNDSWSPSCSGISDDEYQLWIFDRWGNFIFQASQQNNVWDGTHNGKKCLVDTYTWKLKLTDVFQEEHKYMGHINLLK